MIGMWLFMPRNHFEDAIKLHIKCNIREIITFNQRLIVLDHCASLVHVIMVPNVDLELHIHYCARIIPINLRWGNYPPSLHHDDDSVVRQWLNESWNSEWTTNEIDRRLMAYLPCVLF